MVRGSGCVVFALLFAACGDDGTPDGGSNPPLDGSVRRDATASDARSDAATDASDGSTSDAALDAGQPQDAEPADSFEADAETVDGDLTDAPGDADVVDVELADAPGNDAGSFDAIAGDVGPPDSGAPIAGGSGWSAGPVLRGPQDRYGHRMIWADGELIVAGGRTPTYSGEYAAYNPRTNEWGTGIAVPPMIRPRIDHVLAWTGRYVLVWGGSNGLDYLQLNSGEVLDTWLGTVRPMSEVDAPSPRGGAQGLWTGRELYVWDGFCINDCAPQLSPGARYTPATDRWTPLPAGFPFPGFLLWTGTEALFLGAQGTAGVAFDPVTETTRPLAGSLVAPFAAVGAWTGEGAYLWSGSAGAYYDLAGDRWAPIAATGGPSSPRQAFWSGTELLVTDASGSVYHYDPDADQWRHSVPIGGPITPAVWTGEEIVTYGDAFTGSGPFTTSEGRKYGPDPSNFPGCDGVGPPRVEITTPTARQVARGTQPVTLTVQSTISVSAIELFLDASSLGRLGGLSGSFDASNLSPGAHTLRAVATDALGRQSCHLRTIYRDDLPSVTVSSPYEGQVVTGTVAVRAACQDDHLGCSLRAQAPTQPPLFGPAIDATYDFTGQSGTFPIELRALDRYHQRTIVYRTVIASPGPRLVPHFTPGSQVCDVSTTRGLYVRSASGQLELVIRTLATAAEQIISVSGANVACAESFLATQGAIFVAESSGARHVYTSLGGVLVDRGEMSGGDRLVVSGDRATFVDASNRLQRIDLTNGSAAIAGTSVAAGNHHVNSSGLSTWVSLSGIAYWDLGGQATAISPASAAFPRTDGARVIYRFGQDPSESIRLYDPPQTITLVPSRAWTPEPRAETELDALEGWISYLRPDVQGRLQVIVRGPTGTETQLSIANADHRLRALGPGGRVLFDLNTRLYVAAPGQTAVELSTVPGRIRFRDGELFMIVGADALRYAP